MSVSLCLMARFCENTYRFVGISGVLKQGVALGTKKVYVGADGLIPLNDPPYN